MVCWSVCVIIFLLFVLDFESFFVWRSARLADFFVSMVRNLVLIDLFIVFCVFWIVVFVCELVFVMSWFVLRFVLCVVFCVVMYFWVALRVFVSVCWCFCESLYVFVFSVLMFIELFGMKLIVVVIFLIVVVVCDVVMLFLLSDNVFCRGEFVCFRVENFICKCCLVVLIFWNMVELFDVYVIFFLFVVNFCMFLSVWMSFSDDEICDRSAFFE